MFYIPVFPVKCAHETQIVTFLIINFMCLGCCVNFGTVSPGLSHSVDLEK